MSVTIVDNMAAIMKSLHALTGKDVLVGVPSQKTDRLQKGEPINNATIGYFQEFGAPRANIPARPHLIPGIEAVQPQIAERFKKAAQAALSGDAAGVERQLHAAGMTAQNSVRAMVNSNIQPALSERTLAARKRRGVTRENTLVDTAQYRNSITYVIRKK